MTVTTIKVPAATRDRLKAHAAEYGEPLGAHVERLLDLADRESRFEQLASAVEATVGAKLDDYSRERDEWLDAELA